MPVCVVCTGTEFTCESGYYYCAECQTQSQDIRQEVHKDDIFFEPSEQDDERIHSNERSEGTKVATPALESTITTWEGFNLSLVGLVKELISLGVDSSFKTEILKLWAFYLRKMEIAFFSKSPALPKLGPNFKKIDAHLIYGYFAHGGAKDRKRKAESDVEEENESIDSPSAGHQNAADTHIMKKRQAVKQRTRAFRQNYDKVMKEMSAPSETLTDVTLEMLAVSSLGAEDDEPIELQFNDDCKKVKHIKSTANLNYHPGLLVRNKLLCLIYLGLLRKGEKLKLSDLLRWISEGHVSYSCLHKFFPSESPLRGENIVLFAVHQPTPLYSVLLYSCGRLASYIGLKSIKPPSLKDFIQHYVKELNLPAQVRLLAERLLALLPPPKEFVPTLSKNMPNWEGRAMAHVIIALKLLFGLDDATEHQNSRIAIKINELLSSQNEPLRLFVWDDWERFCILRRTALLLFHEPSFFKSKDLTSMIQNVKPLVSDWEDVAFSSYGFSKRSAIMNDTYKSLISRLKDNNISNRNHVTKLAFPYTFSPLSSYVEVITRAFQEDRFEFDSDEWSQVADGLNLEMLNQSFEQTTIDYLTHPNEYVEWAQQQGLRIGLQRGAAVSAIWARWQEDDPKPPLQRLYYRVKVYLDQVDDLPTSTVPLPVPSTPTLLLRERSVHNPIIFPNLKDTETSAPVPHIVDMQFQDEEKTKFKQGRARVQKKPKRLKPKEFKVLSKEDEDVLLHTPYSEYWSLNFPINPTNSEAPKEFSKIPLSFLHLLEECAMLLKMPLITLYREVLYVERLHRNVSEHLSNNMRKLTAFEELSIATDKDSW